MLIINKRIQRERKPKIAKNLIARSGIQINNTVDEAWNALVNPEIVEKYMLGSQQLSDWRKGSRIVWKKNFNGTKFEDKGEILEITPQKSLKYTHYSPASGKPDALENYQTVSVTLKKNAKGTTIELTSDNNASEKEKAMTSAYGPITFRGSRSSWKKSKQLNRNGLCPLF
jgi:uncharacterized protein YndB with AHSA1/START domain